MLVVTRHAKERGLPLDPAELRTLNRGQVLGLGKGAVQTILNEYGITKILAKEGGRTSRGSLGNMEKYVGFLNQLESEGIADVPAIERWWAARVEDYFQKAGLSLHYDSSKSLRFMVDDLLSQAQRRQKEEAGTMYAGALLQHLVGAKLSIAVPTAALTFNGFSVADESSGQGGDFMLEDVCVHVTTSPGDALLQKCANNIQNGFRPVIVTTASSYAGTQSLANIHGIGERVDIIEAGQFIAANLYEWSLFKFKERKVSVERLVRRYNEIVEMCETDPGLRIKFEK